MAKVSSRKSKSIYDDPPRQQVLLLSCMDLRLLDDIVVFMDGLNLQNRYDHFSLAGAAMGAHRLGSPVCPEGLELPWKAVFFTHLETAINVLKRDIKDIFLLEHIDCGAYKYLHPDPDVKKKYSEERDLTKLKAFHRVETSAFAKEIGAFCKDQHKRQGGDAWEGIRIHCFVMDLIGRVTEL
jgi:hypothetical protein